MTIAPPICTCDLIKWRPCPVHGTEWNRDELAMLREANGNLRAEVEHLREALRTLRIYLEPGSSGTHAAIGEACGVDACIVCLAEHVVNDALTAVPSANTQEDT